LGRERTGRRRDNNWLVRNFIEHPCKYESFLRNRFIAFDHVIYSENNISVIRPPLPGLFSPHSLAGKIPQRPNVPEDTIVETIVCEEFNDGRGNGSSVVTLYS
jgi:hypothetical protein